MATITVLGDISTAPIAGDRTIPIGASTPAPTESHDVGQPPTRGFHHLPVSRPGEPDDARHVARIASISTTSPASTATSVPAPIAMPTSAATSAGASFTPSPPWRRAYLAVADLDLGLSPREGPGKNTVDFISRPTASATARASPVSMTTLIPVCATGAPSPPTQAHGIRHCEAASAWPFSVR